MIQKKGFSLAELMVVMGIMGILAASAMLTFKPFDKGIKFIYSNTFHVLDRALYNAMSSYVEVDMQSRNPYLSKYKNDDGTEETLTHSNELDQGTERLCRALVEYINTIEGDAGCSSTKLVSDMAGDDEDSWKSAFEAEGYEVECILRGLGELPEIQQLYIQHAQEAVDKIN